MATFYLIRHGYNDWLGKGIAGRLPNVHLNERGRAEAQRLVPVLSERGIQRIISSPLERARETAEPLAAALGLQVEISESVHEVNFGDWNGMRLDDLAKIQGWNHWTHFRSGTRAPNGETILEVQSRMIRALEQWRHLKPGGAVAIFSHGDPIRAALVYYLGMPLDFLTRLEVSPGSYNILQIEEGGAEILGVNSLP